MSIDLSYQRFRDCLQLTTHLLDKRGEPIASGESLTLRIKATNLPRIEAHREPLEVAFSNPRVFVRGTNLAAPTEGPSWYPLRKQTLAPRDSAWVDVSFVALRELAWWDGLWGADSFAQSWIFADADDASFTTIWNCLETV